MNLCESKTYGSNASEDDGICHLICMAESLDWV